MGGSTFDTSGLSWRPGPRPDYDSKVRRP